MKGSDWMNYIIVFFVMIILRHFILKYYPSVIVNGYFGIYIMMFFILWCLTRDVTFSIMLALIVILGRIFYRKNVPTGELKNPNSVYHMVIFVVGLLLLFIVISNHKKILAYSYCFPCIIAILIMFILFHLKYQKTNCCLP